MIEPEAATGLSITSATTFTTPLADFETNIATISVPAMPTDYTAIVTGSLERWVTGSTAGAAIFLAYPTPAPSIVTLDGSYTYTQESTSPGRRITIQGQLVVPAGTARDFYLRSIKLAGTAQHECRNINFQVELIKR